VEQKRGSMNKNRIGGVSVDEQPCYCEVRIHQACEAYIRRLRVEGG